MLTQGIRLEFRPLEQNKNKQKIYHQRSNQQWFRFNSHLYINYSIIYKMLVSCYNNLFNEQKQRFIFELIESCMLRIYQLKKQLIYYSTGSNIIRTDYINLQDILIDLRVLPRDIELELPQVIHFTKRDFYVQKMLKNILDQESPEQEIISEKYALDTNMQTAIRLIQKNERGRQGIIRVLKALQFISNHKKVVEQDNDNKAIIIQKSIRGYLDRKKIDQQCSEELQFISLDKKTINQKQKEKYQSFIHKNFENREFNKRQYQKLQKEFKKELINCKQQGLKNKMIEQRKQWISECIKRNDFTSIPQSAKQFYNKNNVYIPKSTTQQSMANKKGNSQYQKFFFQNTSKGPTPTLIHIQQKIQKYTNTWQEKFIDPPPGQYCQQKIMKDQLLPSIQENLKKIVDHMIQLELNKLRILIGKKKKKKKKPKKKKKKTKIPKFPGFKQITKIQPLDQMAHLIDFGILKKLKPAHITDLKGEPFLLRPQQTQLSTQLPDPSIYDIRQVLTQFICFPLLSDFVKQKIPKQNYFLFYGPHGSGKTHAIRAIANQCNAIVLQFSPYTLQNKIQMKHQLLKLMAMTFNIAKLYAPAIIYIDQIEQIFKGKSKKKKGYGLNQGPKFQKLKKLLMVYRKKFFQNSDRVAVIGSTNKPWHIKTKFIKPFCQKYIYFPFPNYGTRKLLFQHFMKQKEVAFPKTFPVTLLASNTEGYSAGNVTRFNQIKQAIDKVVTQNRIREIKKKDKIQRQLNINQFINPLSNQKSTSAEQYQKFKEFSNAVLDLKKKQQIKTKIKQQIKN